MWQSWYGKDREKVEAIWIAEQKCVLIKFFLKIFFSYSETFAQINKYWWNEAITKICNEKLNPAHEEKL